MIRRIRPDDIPILKQLEDGFAWEYGQDFLDALVWVDEDDKPVMAVAAWHRAEVHMVTNKTVETPGVRFSMLKQLHRAMEQHLSCKGVGQAVTWVGHEDNAWCAFSRRLKGLGWVKSMNTSWIKVIS